MPRTTTTLDGVVYAPGAKFRVVREGAKLMGWKAMAPSAWQGTGRDLKVGEVIVCAGYGPGFGSDPGYGVEFLDPDDGRLCEFSPWTGSAFSYRPQAGYLEPVGVDSEEEEV